MSRARDLSRLSNPTNFTPDAATGRVGLGSENPTAKLNVAGIVSATAFYGDGSNLEGVASAGLGTALSDSGPGSVIYYTENTLGIGSTFVVTVPTGSDVAYTQYAEISLDENVDLIVSDGDEFIPDVLGLSTTGITPLTGAGGRIRADFFTNKAGTGAPTFQTGVNITGVATATSFSGATATFTGNVSVGGTLTYEDVKNVDSVGIITARSDVSIADKIVHTGDTNTAIRFPAVDTFTVETAGSERLRVDSSGKTGINVNNPGSYNSAGNELVLGNTSNNGGMTIVSGTGNNGHIFFADGTGTPNQGIIKYEHANDAMAFNTNTGERVRITSAGEVQIANGNLKFSTLGTGIDFSATNDPAGQTSELLDDYEEGTWTPTIGGNATYTNQVGTYVKVGRMVLAQWALTINAQGTGSNISAISGLPYPAGVASQVTSNLLWGGFGVSMAYAAYYVGNASTTMNLSYIATEAAGISNNPNGLVNGATMNGTIVYYSSY